MGFTGFGMFGGMHDDSFAPQAQQRTTSRRQRCHVTLNNVMASVRRRRGRRLRAAAPGIKRGLCGLLSEGY